MLITDLLISKYKGVNSNVNILMILKLDWILENGRGLDKFYVSFQLYKVFLYI